MSQLACSYTAGQPRSIPFGSRPSLVPHSVNPSQNPSDNPAFLLMMIPSRRWHISHVHANLNLPRRRLYHPRRLGPRRQRPAQIPRRRLTPARRPENVRDVGAGLGELVAGVYRAGYVSDPVDFFQVW